MGPLLLAAPPPRLVQLPEDVLVLVLRNLHRDRDVAAARGVCRIWRSVIDYSTEVWRNLHFGPPGRMPTTAESWYRKAAQCGNSQAQVCTLCCAAFIFSLS